MKKCKCQDCNGVVCGKEMTPEEEEQDGMCQACADNVWLEMELYRTEGKDYYWEHKRNDLSK